MNKILIVLSTFGLLVQNLNAGERLAIELRQVVIPGDTVEELSQRIGLEVTKDGKPRTLVLTDPAQADAIWKRLTEHKRAEPFRFHRVLLELGKTTELKSVFDVVVPVRGTSAETGKAQVRYDNVEVGYEFTVYRGGNYVAKVVVDKVWHDLLANKGGERSTNENITRPDIL